MAFLLPLSPSRWWDCHSSSYPRLASPLLSSPLRFPPPPAPLSISLSLPQKTLPRNKHKILSATQTHTRSASFKAHYDTFPNITNITNLTCEQKWQALGLLPELETKRKATNQIRNDFRGFQGDPLGNDCPVTKSRRSVFVRSVGSLTLAGAGWPRTHSKLQHARRGAYSRPCWSHPIPTCRGGPPMAVSPFLWAHGGVTPMLAGGPLAAHSQILVHFSLLWHVRYVGVIRFIFHFSNFFYQLGLHNKNLCCISESTMKHHDQSDWKLDLPSWFGYGCQKCMFVDFLIERIAPPSCVHIWRHSPISFKHVFF